MHTREKTRAFTLDHVFFRMVWISLLTAAMVFLLAGCSGSTASKETDTWDGSIDVSWFQPGQTSYDITSAAQLAGLADLVDSGEAFENVAVNLKINIDLDGRQWNPIGGDPSNAEGTFRGNFHGNGNSIENLYIVSPLGYQALFGSVANGEISDVYVQGEVKGRESSAGIVSSASNESFSNVVSDVNVFSTNYFLNVDTAGLVGHYFADEPGTTFYFRDCVNNGTIDANDWTVAGLVASIGLSEGTSIEMVNCSNRGYVAVDAASAESDRTVAGLVAELGEFGTYTFKNCSNTAEVSGTDVMAVSGLIGVVRSANTTLTDCTNSGDISTGTLNKQSVAAGIVATATTIGLAVNNCGNTGTLSTYNGATINIAPGSAQQ